MFIILVAFRQHIWLKQIQLKSNHRKRSNLIEIKNEAKEQNTNFENKPWIKLSFSQNRLNTRFIKVNKKLTKGVLLFHQQATIQIILTLTLLPLLSLWGQNYTWILVSLILIHHIETIMVVHKKLIFLKILLPEKQMRVLSLCFQTQLSFKTIQITTRITKELRKIIEMD